MKKSDKLSTDIAFLFHFGYSYFCSDVSVCLSDKFLNQPRKLSQHYLNVYNRVINSCYDRKINTQTTAKILERYYALHILKPYNKEKILTEKARRKLRKSCKILKEVSKDFVFTLPTK